MAEGTDNVEDRISCDDSLYGKRNLEVYDCGDGVHSGSDDEEYSSGDTDTLGKKPYQFYLRHSGLRCISGKHLNCPRSLSDVFFDAHFVALATRNPLIAITSLAASGSNPTFRNGTSDDM